MALVAGGSGGGGGGGRLTFSALLRRLYPVRWRRLPGTGDEDEEGSPLINSAPPATTSCSSSGSSSRGRELDSSCTSGPTLSTPLGHLVWPARDLFDVGPARREGGTLPLRRLVWPARDLFDTGAARREGSIPPLGHLGWPARNLFDMRAARRDGVKRDLEMATSTWQAPRLPGTHVLPPMAVVDAMPGQPPTQSIPLTDGLVASFLAFQQGVQLDGTNGASMTANCASTPAASASKGEPTKWMKVFRGLLLAHVFFALPLLLIFFPRYEKEKAKSNSLLSLFDGNEDNTEKLIVLAFFVAHASLGSLAVPLAHIADGPICMDIVGSLTLCIIISVVGFVDYIFLKTLPDNSTYQLVFLVHFIVMLVVICWLWAKFVGISQCFSSQDTSSDQGLRRRPPV